MTRYRFSWSASPGASVKVGSRAARANCRAKIAHADWYGAALASVKTMLRDVRRDPYAPAYARPYECDVCGFWHVTSKRPRAAA